MMTMLRRTVVKSLALLMAAALLVSCDPFGLRDVLEAASRSVLSIDPRNVEMPAGATVAFTADGGVPPYTYSLTGDGSIDPVTGVYTAGLSAGAATIIVTDTAGATTDTAVVIEPLASGLHIVPSNITVVVNAAVSFTAVGGTPPYAFAVTSAGSGSPVIDPATGEYTAGGSIGLDNVEVTDSLANTSTAVINVVAVASSVDYSVSSMAGLPASGVAGSVIPGGLTFTVTNSGAGAGSDTIAWKVYLSANASLDGGDVVVTEGISGALAAGASTPVGLGGAWPSGPVGPGFLIATVSSADDTTPGNNTSAAHPFTLDPRPVDYDVISVSHAAGTFTGQSVTGSFTVQNIGAAGGAAALYWYVYASTDTVVDGGDYLLQSGTRAALGSGSSAAIPISSTWPTTPASYYLLVRLSAADDVAAGNDTGWSSAIPVTGAPPADIDYHAAAPVNTGGTTAGGAMAGTFQVSNGGGAAGSQTLYWTVYRSADATLEIGTDPVAAMGSRAALGAGASVPVGYAGSWPAGATTWHLFAVVSAGDDVDPLDNESTGSPVAVAAPDVDYHAAAPVNSGGTTAGDPMNGTFQLSNGGLAPGSQTVYWTIYRSPDPTLETGTDVVAAMGSRAALGGSASAPVGYSGTWPAGAGTWYLFAVVSAGDDKDPLDNNSTGTAVGVTEPNADYDVVSVTSTGGTTAGGPLAGSFTVTNLGPHDGTQAVPWRAYLSTNAVYDAGVDILVDSGVIPSPGLIKLTPTGETFGGTWPDGAAIWYLIVVLDAGDDQNAANDWGASGPVPVTVPNVNYDVLSVTNTGATIAGGALTAEFVVKNIGTDPGSRTVYWSAYRSNDAVLTIGVDDVIGSGSSAALPDSDSATIPFTSTWPAALSIKTYFLFVRVFVTDDVLVTDDTEMSVIVTVNPPNVDYDIIAVNNTGGLVAGGVLGGSMQIQNVGSVNGSRTVYWNVYRSLDAVYTMGVDPVVDSGTIPGGLTAGNSANPTFTGTWPEDIVAHTYYYIVKITAADDINAANDEQASSTWFQVDPPTLLPDYRVLNPMAPSTGTPSAPLGGTRTFQIKNTAANPGTKPITWRVYASTDGALDEFDTQISAGSTGALAGSGTSTTITYGGTWPAMGSWYRLIVSLSAADDSNPANDRWVSGPVSILEMAYTEGGEDNSGIGPWPGTLSKASATGIVMTEGRYVQINGTFDAKSNYDTYKLQFGPDTTQIQIVVTWATGTDAIDFHLWDETGLYGDSLALDPNVEEVTYTGLTPGGTWYVGVSFIGTTSYTGQPYQMTLYAEPD